MDEETFKRRTKELGIRVIKVVESLDTRRVCDVIGRQLLKCGTSVGANYRAACRGRSTADVIAKLAIVEEEADETLYWLETLIEANVMPAARLHDLMGETDEILAMTVASMKTLKSRVQTLDQSKIRNRKSKIAHG